MCKSDNHQHAAPLVCAMPPSGLGTRKDADGAGEGGGACDDEGGGADDYGVVGSMPVFPIPITYHGGGSGGGAKTQTYFFFIQPYAHVSVFMWVVEINHFSRVSFGQLGKEEFLPPSLL